MFERNRKDIHKKMITSEPRVHHFALNIPNWTGCSLRARIPDLNRYPRSYSLSLHRVISSPDRFCVHVKCSFATLFAQLAVGASTSWMHTPQRI